LRDRGLCRIIRQLRKGIAKDKVPIHPWIWFPKKSWLEFSSEPASFEFVFYANLIAIVVMIPMVAVSPMPVAVVGGPCGITIISIRSVVSIRIIAIAISVTRITIIAISIRRIPKSDSYAPDSD
jgi:hypothetical protein